MIGYLRGEIMEVGEGRLLLAISAGQGAIGYSMHTPHGPEYGLLVPGKLIELFVHTHVREDVLDLFGFLTRAEKDFFHLLLTVSGIGPKGALGILSGGAIGDLVRAILDRDKDFLTGLPGVGKKTAERVVVELSDSLRKKVDAGAFIESRPPGGKAGTGATDARAGTKFSSVFRDARDALLGLGYREQEVTVLLQKVTDDEASAPRRVEDLVRLALRQLSS